MWDNETVSIFCNLCIVEVEEGRRPGTHFTKIGWENLVKNFCKATGREYSKLQLKNKWDALKNDWKLWKDLIGKETGLGWNIQKKTIDASPEWWQSKLKANPKVEKFRKEGIDKELEGKLDRMFMNITATGNKAWTPSSGVIPLDDYEDSNNDTIFPVEENSDSDKDMQVQYTYQCAKEKKDEKVVGLHSTQAKKIKKGKKVDHAGRKVGGATKISQQIERLVEAVENRSSTLINLQKEMNGCSIAEAMKIVESIPGVEIGGNIWLFATQLLIRFVYNMDMLDDEQEFDSIISTFTIAVDYYYRTYIHKQPCMNSSETGHGVGNRLAQERFQHSGETVSRYFGEALDAICRLSIDLIKPFDPEFKDIPEEILKDSRYMPHFKDCIGAIDGTHVHVSIPPEDQIPYIGRKGIPTQNIMAACNFDMQFIFAIAGWEGSAHDTRIFLSTLRNPTLNFPKPPRGERYHLPDFRRGSQPTGYQEVFNHSHSSLRSVIERTFGVWKKRWKILRDMPSYPFNKQVKIIIATMALHNYIRRHARHDKHFENEENEHNDYTDEETRREVNDGQEGQEEEYINNGPEAREMEVLRNNIATSLMRI
ncbi:DDE Tnp4 domain-containing protein [Citrus sinensis]|uniref:DDE Tnp4 domain-containing protein n=1 Tax=Citrus sinensis TaxID=2711 RepID=A0ACB8I0U1_CITSI|nr:DDE Tnp4 domain-containing protein [Citrus sinensis]